MAAPFPLTLKETVRLRLRSQGLHPEFRLGDAHALATHLCGLQAQEIAAGTLAIRPRTQAVTADDVGRARNLDRSLVRTWVMRNTLHLIAAEDVGWLLALLGPRAIRSTQRRREQLGLSEPIVARGIALIRTLLADGPLPRRTLIARLAQEGIPTAGQAGIHLLGRAALEGVIAYGPDAGKQPTFVLLDEWLRATVPTRPPDPLAALARRYLAAYAPAAPADLAAWAGIALTEARAAFAGLADECIPVRIDGEPAWLLEAQAVWLEAPGEDQPLVRLLPNFDTILLGWRSRDPILAAEYRDRIFPGGGILRACLLVDGVIVGRWSAAARRKALIVTVECFRELRAAARDALETEAQDVGRFLGLATTLSLHHP